MEKKIKRRAIFYGLAAILLATVLGTVIYDYRILMPESLVGASPIPIANAAFVSTFQSADELKTYLTVNSRTQGYFPFYGPYDARVLNSMPSFQTFVTDNGALQGLKSFAAEASSAGGTTSFDHSSTNIQVAGVDEIDTVKVDDEGYMYVISGNTIIIVKAYPSSVAEVVSRITLDDLYPVGIFVKGDRLAILSCKYNIPSAKVLYYYYYNPEIKTSLKIYDVRDRARPALVRDLTLTGSYFDSRMIGNYVYFVVSKQAYLLNDTIVLPEITSNGKAEEIAPTVIHYINGTNDYYVYTTFIAVNIENTAEAPVYLTIMLANASQMYVSLDNIYITFQNWSSETTIYRVHVQDNNMTVQAMGNVSGYVSDQFSMDEYEDYFRIITTSWTEAGQGTNVYVLDLNLSLVGKLENLAIGENFHSSRFMGKRAYLVTFQVTDPLFVINLTDPAQPRVLGKLVIPGYSDYLHPYDETHLIGVGKETTGGIPAWNQGIKISLFDVSNVTNPTQLFNYPIGDRGSDSPVLTDHKAFLFDQEKNLLVIPVQETKVDQSQYPDGVPSWTSGELVWQGAYVFDLTLDQGFQLKGKITHINSDADLTNANYWIKRSLYIEDILYTVSDKTVKLNNLEDLEFIKDIVLS